MRRIGLFVGVLALVASGPAVAFADVPEALADLARKTVNSSAAINFDFELTSGETQHMTGQAICIHKADNGIGTFITFAYRPDMKPETIQNMKLIISGPQAKEVPAEFLTVEPLLNLVFLRAKEPFDWNPVTFHKAATQVGQQVVSVGLMSPEVGYQPYLGMGYVSAIMRVPETLVRVAGGTLTNVGSPVFDLQGRAIGVVGRQLPSSFVMSDGRQSAPITLRGTEESSYFTPTEVFAFALESASAPGKIKRLPWIGVLQFLETDKQTDLVAKDTPAVKVGKVIPGTPADKAGLKDLDVIVSLNGQPLEAFPAPELVQAAFVRKLMGLKSGEKVTLGVLRGGVPQDVTVVTEDMPLRPFEANQYTSRALGLRVRDRVMLDDYISKDPLPKVPGVLAAVGQGSPAANGGLQTGDLITTVGAQSTPTADTFKKVLEAALGKGGPIEMIVNRAGKDVNVKVTPAAPRNP